MATSITTSGNAHKKIVLSTITLISLRHKLFPYAKFITLLSHVLVLMGSDTHFKV